MEVRRRVFQIIGFGTILLFNSTIAHAHSVELPAVNESGVERATSLISSANNNQSRILVLEQAMNLRYEKNGVLEFKTEAPVGARIELPANYQVKHLDFRSSNGKLDRSSTGFVTPVRVVSFPQGSSQSQDKINELNQTPGGLYISASIIGDLEGITGSFATITGGEPSPGYLKYYEPSGKPKFSYTKSITTRFGDRMNQGVDPSRLPENERVKWQKIYAELKKVADRTVETPKSLLMIDRELAHRLSQQYEKDRTISPIGAWTIAVQSTAVRNGFPNVPCAEFMSEVLRQAYQRAGYRVTDDFNVARDNELIWSKTASVVGFSNALFVAGWIPWDGAKYRPLTGAILMHSSGRSPGHTYISAGHDGRLIMDNGAPQGRDLRVTTEKTNGIMFQTGLFFLPPGINPPQW